MIGSLIVALILIAIVCVIAGALLRVIPNIPAPVPVVVWALVAVICLLLLLDVLTGRNIAGLHP